MSYSHDCWACERDVAHRHDGSDWSGCAHWPTTPGDVAGCCADHASERVALLTLALDLRAGRATVPDLPPVPLDTTEAELRALFYEVDPLRAVWFNDGAPVERDPDAPCPADAPWTWSYPDAPPPAA